MNLTNILLTLAFALVLGAAHLLDGPSEMEMAEAVAEEVLSAPSAVREQARLEFFQQVAEISR